MMKLRVIGIILLGLVALNATFEFGTLHVSHHLLILASAITALLLLTGVLADWRRYIDPERAIIEELGIMSHMSDGIALYDEKERLVFCNEPYRNLASGGRSHDRIRKGAKFDDIFEDFANCLVFPESAPDRESFLAERRAEHKHVYSEIEVKTKRGMWLRIRRWPTKLGGTIILITDVTSEHNLREAAESHSEQFQSLIENAPEGVLVLREDKPIYANQALACIFDYATPADIMALPSIDCLFEPEERDKLRLKLVANAMVPADRHAREYLGVTRGGEPVWLEIRSTVIVWDGAAAIQASIVDIGARKKQEHELRTAKEEAEAANRAKSNFLANMSHELRTPLNAVIGFSEIIKDEQMGPLENKKYREYAEDIHQSGSHLLKVINDILDVAKAESGKLDLHEVVVPLYELGNTALRMVGTRAEENGVILKNDVPLDLPPLLVDELKTVQVLLNLLSNAVKFTLQGGQISLAAALAEDDGIEITVTDTGIGIAEENLPRALEAFSQIDNSLSRRYEGTGLGLPLVNALVQLHGGHFHIESEVGVGTRAVIRFPPWRVMKLEPSLSDQAVSA